MEFSVGCPSVKFSPNSIIGAKTSGPSFSSATHTQIWSPPPRNHHFAVVAASLSPPSLSPRFCLSHESPHRFSSAAKPSGPPPRTCQPRLSLDFLPSHAASHLLTTCSAAANPHSSFPPFPRSPAPLKFLHQHAVFAACLSLTALGFICRRRTFLLIVVDQAAGGWDKKGRILGLNHIRKTSGLPRFSIHTAGGKLVMFRSPNLKSLKSNVFLKKTMKLSNKDIIGSGGFGTVYKVFINDCISFAVKKLNRLSGDQDGGFERELEAMGDIKHRNIVTLHGYYTAPQYNLLIYELMPNGSLHTLLHGNCTNKMVLDWATRHKIAVGAARGIAYLHHDCIPHIIHRDIKSSNILLDHNLDARVSDFGLATLMEPGKTHVSTLAAGTFGYLPPEYFDTGKATVKGDVYSFGVVLLELLTGRKPTDETFVEEGTKLVTWVKSVVEEKREEYVVDSSLIDYPVDEMNGVFGVALTCLEAEPSKRPTMAQVVKMLEQIRPHQPPTSEFTTV